jgi:hypothetical protein
MITEKLPHKIEEVKAEKLLAEIRAFVRSAILKEITLKDARELLIKLDNWEASK